MPISHITGLSIIDSSRHCKHCHALVYTDQTIDGYGVSCGCAQQQYLIMKKLIKSQFQSINDIGLKETP